ncbi:MAG: methyltransferase domain-containing protein [Betaproteobacteria bacterium]|nr:methyltransferase domain-containing protein [Betaproteobacteria bacterium]
MSLCRLCKHDLTNHSVVTLAPFPSAAQYFPGPGEFDQDSGITLEVMQCPMCALVQLANPPVAYFKEVITAASLSPIARQTRLGEFKRFVEEFELAGSKAIEIGSGKGDMIGVLRDAGLKAVGLEYSEDSVAFARANSHEAFCGYVEDVTLPDQYRFFACLNYLEHQPDIGSFIRALHRITDDQSFGYITVPNLDYLLTNAYLYEFVADHLVYFTRQTLTRAFELHGFEALRCTLINNQNDIALLVKKRQPLVIKEERSKVDLLCEHLRKIVADIHKRGSKVAVWGAGHRTLALLAISGIRGIEFVVDSASFKQGKYTPLTHFKIVSPSQLEVSDVDTVIVMVPGIYPEEVVKSVKNMNRPIHVLMQKGNTILEAD